MIDNGDFYQQGASDSILEGEPFLQRPLLRRRDKDRQILTKRLITELQIYRLLLRKIIQYLAPLVLSQLNPFGIHYMV